MSNNAKFIWNYLVKSGLQEYAVAGIMGNLYAESGLIPTNLQNSFNKKFDMNDEEYTNGVDYGSYRNFINDRAGYGLCQWTYWSRKEKLLELAEKKHTSIGDLSTQLEFLLYELEQMDLIDKLQSSASVLEASNIFLFEFERPANQGDDVQKQRSEYGLQYYKKYSKENDKMADVKKDNIPDEWAEDAVRWAINNEILFGDEEGNYKLHKSCTRQEMLVFLNRTYELIEKERS